MNDAEPCTLLEWDTTFFKFRIARVRRLLRLPFYNDLTEPEQAQVVEAILDFDGPWREVAR